MKRLSILAITLPILTVISCNKSYDNAVYPCSAVSPLTINANRPEGLEESRTGFDDAGNTYWCPSDAIGVISGESGALRNDRFVNTGETISKTASFYGEAAVSGTLYAYFPYYEGIAEEEYVTVNIPEVQIAPEAGKSDPVGDILTALPVERTLGTDCLDGLRFKRLSSFVKINLTDCDSGIASEELYSVKFLTGSVPVTGEVALNYKTGVLSDFAEGCGKSSVSVEYPSGQRPALGAGQPVIAGVHPAVLPVGTVVKFEIITKNYLISKTVPLEKAISFKEGKGTTINLSLKDASIEKKLYIYFWKWSVVSNAQEMTPLGDGKYSWTGDCPEGEFKFLTEKGNYWTGYFRDPDATDYWTIKETNVQTMFKLSDKSLSRGRYLIEVDVKNLSVKVTPVRLLLYFWGYEHASNAKEMTPGEVPGTFSWTGYITEWQFKFMTTNENGDDYWTGYFRDPAAADYWTLTPAKEQNMFQLHDVGWRDGVYTINVDLNSLKVEMVPHVWPIGAFSWGWRQYDAEEMTYKGNGVLEWTGTIYRGDFKFLTRQDAWEGYWRDASAVNYWTITTDGTGDVQFNIASDGFDSGTYKLVLDINNKTVSVSPSQF